MCWRNESTAVGGKASPQNICRAAKSAHSQGQEPPNYPWCWVTFSEQSMVISRECRRGAGPKAAVCLDRPHLAVGSLAAPFPLKREAEAARPVATSAASPSTQVYGRFSSVKGCSSFSSIAAQTLRTNSTSGSWPRRRRGWQRRQARKPACSAASGS